ncbi:ComEC/Rec2 family competence protein [Corynebacterium aurimucosum]|uniref:ComEC/Rec2 family competence protein n=1 Tax=Corynebacterium aurimucosum TaxID=169292 RepID=UPI0018795291|nr:ComEC/Rec2 family competence protein [Corynebacterium aurimucosum]MBE7365468.1 ComEC/Rec2 family competence protein [Corynebacterium aurimucosum]
MRELRLVPAAVVAWLATLAVLFGHPWLLGGLVCFALARGQWRGQGILCAASGVIFATLAYVRSVRAAAFHFGSEVTGKLAADPVQTASGWMVRLRVPGYPAQLPVFLKEEPEAFGGSLVTVHGHPGPSDQVGVGTTVFSGELTAHAHSWTATVAANFRDVCDNGLIPGMVLGDTSLQSPEDKQLYIDTGLSHLSAVSGSNVAIVCTAAALVVPGQRVRVGASASALALFVALVGWEPSVQRATVAGLAGLAAVLSSSKMEPLHALALGVLFLLAADSDLAVSFGFALSVAATAGIVVLSPLLLRVLGTGIVARAFAVAIAADIVTMPLIALMSGRVSVVSVIANVLVGPVVPIITVVGLIAAVLAQVGWGRPLVILIEPLADWIHFVASSMPVTTVAAGPIAMLLLGGWVIAALLR